MVILGEFGVVNNICRIITVTATKGKKPDRGSSFEGDFHDHRADSYLFRCEGIFQGATEQFDHIVHFNPGLQIITEERPSPRQGEP